MTRYQLFLTLHVLAAMVWVGGSTVYLLLHQYLHARATRTELFAALDQTDRIAPFLFPPATLATLTFGVLLVVTGSWSFSDTWVALGLGGLVVAFVLGAIGGVVLSANLNRLRDRLGVDAPEVSAASRRVLVAGYLEIVVLVGVVFVMYWKPGG